MSHWSDVVADATADARASELERCNITVVKVFLPILTPFAFEGPTAQGDHTHFAVFDCVDCVGLYDDAAAAYAFAHELARDILNEEE